MSENIIRPAAWRRETGERLKHFQIAATTQRTVDLGRYAREERWRRRLDIIATLVAIAVGAFFVLMAATHTALVFGLAP